MALITNSNINNIVKSEDYYVLHCHSFDDIDRIMSRHQLKLYDGNSIKYLIVEMSILTEIMYHKLIHKSCDIYRLKDRKGSKIDYITYIENLNNHIMYSKDFVLVYWQ